MVRSGLEVLLARPGGLRGARLGLIANPASVTSELLHASQALEASGAFRLRALLGPEHGIWANAQDLIELGDGRDPATGLPVFSLYGETRAPTAAMLDGLDALVFDLQDVGSRYYTFIYTMLYALEACARHRRRLVVLDRPNPLGGTVVDGNVLDAGFRSFVGLHPLAVRHGMTTGELALLFREELGLRVELHVVRMRGWRREMAFEDTGLPWVAAVAEHADAWTRPSSIQAVASWRERTSPRAAARPARSSSWARRGSTRSGSPSSLARERLPGVRFRPAFFTPTFQKHAGAVCGGVQVHVSDRRRFPAFLTYLLLIAHARAQDKKRFAWREPPYEYERVKRPIDILCGSERERRTIEAGRSPRSLVPQWRRELAAFRKRRARHLLYA